mmetsp:Transcript_19756/g.30000  ORF Transcript_19756/g.30000 Transcript_19756/m.30000 type:complete len:212 (+) Transcript_19756:2184-2819(+)
MRFIPSAEEGHHPGDESEEKVCSNGHDSKSCSCSASDGSRSDSVVELEIEFESTTGQIFLCLTMNGQFAFAKTTNIASSKRKDSDSINDDVSRRGFSKECGNEPGSNKNTLVLDCHSCEGACLSVCDSRESKKILHQIQGLDSSKNSIPSLTENANIQNRSLSESLVHAIHIQVTLTSSEVVINRCSLHVGIRSNTGGVHIQKMESLTHCD